MRLRRVEWMACALLAGTAAVHAQETYPVKSITLILPYATASFGSPSHLAAERFVGFWLGLVAAAGTPRPIIDKWAAAVTRILALPDIKEKMETMGSEPYSASPDEFAARMRADAAKYADVIRQRNIRLK